MKNSLNIVLVLIILAACQRIEKPQISNYQSELNLKKAEKIRFTQPEKVDAILKNNFDSIVSENNDQLWAKYYFIKAHVAMDGSRFSEALNLIDTAQAYGLNDAVYTARVTLLHALMQEKLLLYKEALTEYNKLLLDDNECLLTPNEKLIVYIAKARIAKVLNMSFDAHLDKLEQFVATEDELNIGLYYSNRAFLTDVVEDRIYFNKKSLNYSINENQKIKVFQSYCNLSMSYIKTNIDSAAYFINEANIYSKKNQLGRLINNSGKECSYFYIKTAILFKCKDYEACLKYIEKGIPVAKRLHLELEYYLFLKMKSNIYFEQQRYFESRELATSAYNHYLKYKKRISADEVKYLETKNHINALLKENRTMRLKKTNLLLEKKLYIFYSIIVSLAFIILIFQWQLIKKKVINLHGHLHQKDISLNKLENKIGNIHKHIKESVHPEKIVLSKVHNEITSDTSNWDSFYTKYNYKYPECENKIKNHFPKLTLKDTQFLMCLHYGSSNQNICTIFNIKSDAIRKKMERIRKKIDLPARSNVHEILKKLLKS